MARGNRADSFMGQTAGTAGDVNGDGFSDIIVGAYRYADPAENEGAAFVWLGSATGLGAVGLPSNADWMVEGDQAEAWLGWSLGTAGDVNGDGFSDAVVGAHNCDVEGTGTITRGGRALIYLGSPDCLSTTAHRTFEGDQVKMYLGYSAGSAGDVNGDGYADVVIGTHGFDVTGTSTVTNAGRALVYYGSATGLGATPDWAAVGDQVDGLLGVSASTAGDVNGDGYADLIVGAYPYDNPERDDEQDEGAAFVYYGSGGDGLDLVPRQMRTDGLANISPLGMSDSPTGVQLRMTGRMPLGREDVKLQ
jgi:hypothetical protein